MLDGPASPRVVILPLWDMGSEGPCGSLRSLFMFIVLLDAPLVDAG